MKHREVWRFIWWVIDRLLNPWIILAIFTTIKVYSVRNQITADGYFIAAILFLIIGFQEVQKP